MYDFVISNLFQEFRHLLVLTQNCGANYYCRYNGYIILPAPDISCIQVSVTSSISALPSTASNCPWVLLTFSSALGCQFQFMVLFIFLYLCSLNCLMFLKFSWSSWASEVSRCLCFSASAASCACCAIISSLSVFYFIFSTQLIASWPLIPWLLAISNNFSIVSGKEQRLVATHALVLV